MPYQPRTGLRQALRSRQPLFGLLALSGSAQLVEMGGFLGLDFVIIDMEHAAGVGAAEVLQLIRAADGSGLPSLVRVARNEPDTIQAVLDCGAVGVCVPHVSSAAEASRAVAAARYPPEGRRSTCPYIRASAYGGRADVESYAAEANRETVVMALVEDPAGLERLEEIAAVPGLDVVGIGFSDLARALGLAGDATHPDLEAARSRLATLAGGDGPATWTTLTTSLTSSDVERSAELAQRLGEGYTMFSWQDASIFREAVLALRRAVHSNAFSPSR